VRRYTLIWRGCYTVSEFTGATLRVIETKLRLVFGLLFLLWLDVRPLGSPASTIMVKHTAQLGSCHHCHRRRMHSINPFLDLNSN
jgi:hypothetical protein